MGFLLAALGLLNLYLTIVVFQHVSPGSCRLNCAELIGLILGSWCPPPRAAVCTMTDMCFVLAPTVLW